MAITDNLAILITDIVGYTESTAKQTRIQQKQMMSRHNRILYPMIARFHGKLVKSFGDGVLASFRSPTNALRCAMAIQDALAELNRELSEDERIEIRTGINVGEVRIEKKDVFGEAVNLAARVEAMAPSGEVYFTEAVYLAMNKAEIATESVGAFELKGVPEKINIYRVPQHVTQRLVTHQELHADDQTMPFGGMHLFSDEYADNGVIARVVAFWAKRPSLSAMLASIPAERRKPAASLAGGAVALLVLILLLAFTWDSDDEVPEPEVIAETESAPVVSNDRNEQTTPSAVEANTVPIAVVPVISLEEQAEIHLQEAAQHLAENDRMKAAASLGEAFALQPSLAAVEKNAEDLVKCLSWGASVATPIIRAFPSEAMMNALIARTTQPGKIGAGRALALLEETGNSDLVDWQTVALNKLKLAQSCEEKAAAANQLAKVGDQRAVPALKELRGSRLSFTFNWQCGRSEANDALKAIKRRTPE